MSLLLGHSPDFRMRIRYTNFSRRSSNAIAALFQSKVPDQIGPIRSARDYFVHLAEGMDAFYIAHGYSPDAKKLLDDRVVDYINGIHHDGTLFERSADRRAPHNSYISKEHIAEAFSLVNASKKITASRPFLS